MPTSFPGAKQTFPSAATLVGAAGDTMNAPNNQPTLIETLGDTLEALQDALGFGAARTLNITASDGSGTRSAIWVGTTDPAGLAADGDVWVSTANGVLERVGGVWTTAALGTNANLENLHNVTVVGSEQFGDGLILSSFGWINFRARAYVGRVIANARYR